VLTVVAGKIVYNNGRVRARNRPPAGRRAPERNHRHV
jgi:hypothetical protein